MLSTEQNSHLPSPRNLKVAKISYFLWSKLALHLIMSNTYLYSWHFFEGGNIHSSWTQIKIKTTAFCVSVRISSISGSICGVYTLLTKLHRKLVFKSTQRRHEYMLYRIQSLSVKPCSSPTVHWDNGTLSWMMHQHEDIPTFHILLVHLLQFFGHRMQALTLNFSLDKGQCITIDNLLRCTIAIQSIFIIS